MKEKKKVTLFEQMTFSDATYAQSIIDDCERKKKRNNIGLIAAGIATVVDFIVGTFFFDYFLYTTIILAVVALLIGGGLVDALKTILKLTKFAWFIIPIFPIDLVLAFVVFGTCGIMIALFPISFVLIARYKIWRDQRDAEQYLAAYNPAE